MQELSLADAVLASAKMASPSPIPAVTEIDLLPFAEIVNNARIDHERGLTTGVVATTNDGQPDVALKGSLMVWDKDHLAWWERAKRETYGALGGNPKVAILVRNPTRDKRTLRFYGEARVLDDPDLTRRIWDRVLQVEKDADKERQGIAVLVRIDRVRAGPLDIQRRSRT
jgi:pyridoxamine 5'-phosphate oxidase-like protein